MKYAIIGAGISGLSVASILSVNNEVVVFEGNDSPGGLIRCKQIQGSLFHQCGGHIFNTKRKDVYDWFWNLFNREKDFISAERNAVVSFDECCFVPYPVENHIYRFDEKTCKNIIKDLIDLSNDNALPPSNFEEFLRRRFGETLYNLYFEPYNLKVWKTSLKNIPLSWLDGKLPMPHLEDILYHNIYRVEEKTFVHSSFYYPKKGGSQFIADTLASKIDVRYNHRINEIKREREQYLICGELFDRVVFCGNIKQLPRLVADSVDISNFIQSIDNLAWHGTTSVFCELEQNPYSWVYMPSRKHESHRIICTGNFSPQNNFTDKLTGTVEFTDYKSEEEIIDNLKRIPFSPKYLASNYEKYTYPIQHEGNREMVQQLKRKLSVYGIYLTGRFADWEYYNMDAAIGAAIDTVATIDENSSY